MERHSVAQGADTERGKRDTTLLFLTRFLRLFGYGLLSVVLVLYLSALGFDEVRIGLLLTLTLVGDTALSLFLTTRADGFGRRRVLICSAWLMVFAAVLLAASDVFAVLLVAMTVGVLSPSGNEAGPFLPVEQAALAEFVPAEQRTRLFAWYNLTGSLGTALGALCAGFISSAARHPGLADAASYRPVVFGYALIGLALILCFRKLSPAIETGPSGHETVAARRWGLHQSAPLVRRISLLFALDAFGGGLVIQSVLAWWLHLRFGVSATALGTLFFAANLCAGLSYLAAGWLARRIGLVNTMVFTHLPANVLLMLVPLMPDFSLAAALLLLRSLVTQMDVPTRQAYLMAVVHPDERSAAAGVTGVARSLGAATAPFLSTVLAGSATLAGLPFVLGGSLKIVYDLMLYRGFRHVKPPHEQR